MKLIKLLQFVTGNFLSGFINFCYIVQCTEETFSSSENQELIFYFLVYKVKNVQERAKISIFMAFKQKQNMYWQLGTTGGNTLEAGSFCNESVECSVIDYISIEFKAMINLTTFLVY